MQPRFGCTSRSVSNASVCCGMSASSMASGWTAGCCSAPSGTAAAHRPAGAMAEPVTERSRGTVITVMGIGQVLVWGSSYYLPAVLAKPIASQTGWPLSWVIGALSLALLVSGLVSPKVGGLIERYAGGGEAAC